MTIIKTLEVSKNEILIEDYQKKLSNIGCYISYNKFNGYFELKLIYGRPDLPIMRAINHKLGQFKSTNGYENSSNSTNEMVKAYKYLYGTFKLYLDNNLIDNETLEAMELGRKL